MASIRKQRAAYYCLGGKQSSLSTFLITILSPNTLRVDKKGEGEGDEVEDESRDEETWKNTIGDGGGTTP